jgi:hypothetical protein
MGAASGSDVDAIADLLAEPASVFAHRLEAETGLTPEEKESLKGAFKELLNLQAEQEHGGGASVTAHAPREGRP